MKLFVYGIFLGQDMRDSYGMYNAQYATLKDYVTVGGHIVQAKPVETGDGIALTGLVVDVDPTKWEQIDRLEGGYHRVVVRTIQGTECYIYVKPQDVLENHSTLSASWDNWQKERQQRYERIKAAEAIRNENTDTSNNQRKEDEDDE